MDSRFEQKTAKVLVVEAASSARQLLVEGIHALGFEAIQSVASVKAALSLLEVEQADWLVTSLGNGEAVNALHVLKICTQHPALRHMRMSLFVEDSEHDILPRAFELGLFSWHKKPINRESLQRDLQQLEERMRLYHWDSCIAAAAQRRELLVATNQQIAALNLDEQLAKVFPGNLSLLLWLAESKFMCGQAASAMTMLQQLKMVAPSLADGASALLQRFHTGPVAEVDTKDTAPINLFNLGSCLILDTDTQSQTVIKEVLAAFGVTDIKVIEDGESAWQHIKETQEPALIITEWRLPKLATPFLVQRLRQHGFYKVPIIVVSSLLRQQDHILAREIGVTTQVAKPCNREKLFATLIHALQQTQQPTEQAAIESRIRQHLTLRQLTAATTLRDIYLADPAVSVGQKSEIAAEFAYFAGEYQVARDLAMEALRQNGDTLRVLSLLAKTLMQLRDFTTAIKCLEKADSLAPHNIARLCALAEAQTELGHHDEASAAMDNATRLDAEAAKIAQTHVKLALTRGDTERARSLLGTIDAPETIVAFLNNRAVALACCGDIEAGLKAYDTALESIPDELAELRAVVNYNLALALCRSMRLEDARLYLREALKVKSRVFAKAHNLLGRVEASILSGMDFKLATSARGPEGHSGRILPPEKAAATSNTPSDLEPLPDPEVIPSGDLDAIGSHSDLMSMLTIQRGTMCCHMLYRAMPANQPMADGLLAKMPRFALRRAIERDEALGIDRVRANTKVS